MDISVVIPNLNGKKFMKKCLDALALQEGVDFEVIVADNGSTDGSDVIAGEFDAFPVKVIRFSENKGFAGAVNEGIKAASADYVFLLNNDAYVLKDCLLKLYEAIRKDAGIGSVQCLMLSEANPELIDSAGDYFCALGWGFSYGKDQKATMKTRENIFSSCAGAAVYSKKALEEIGLFDDGFFAYLEDMDVGYRLKLRGYCNRLEKEAKVCHVGSGFSGSRHNAFKVRLSARNSMYLIRKNWAVWQRIVNFIPVFTGVLIKAVFFASKGLFKPYMSGIASGLFKRKIKKTKAKRKLYRLKNEGEMISNIFKRI